MKHKFNTLYVTIRGDCERCKQTISSTKTISTKQVKQYASDIESRYIISYVLQEAYKELDSHTCPGLT